MSGSMGSCLEGTLEGTGQYISDLKKEYEDNPEKGDIFFSLTIFDTVFEPWIINQHIKDVDLDVVKRYGPRGYTALYDAIGKTSIAVEENISEDDGVLVVVMSDGKENSSREFDEYTISTFIQEREGRGNWTFVYLGADVNAPQVAKAMGMSANNAAYFSKSKASYSRTAQGVTSTTSSLRDRGGAYSADSFAVAGASTDYRDEDDPNVSVYPNTSVHVPEPAKDPIDLKKYESKGKGASDTLKDIR